MTRDHFIKVVALNLGVGEGAARARYMVLRDAGLIPLGGGRRSPELGLKETAVFVTALAIRSGVASAAEETAAYLGLPHHCEDSGLTAGDAVLGFLEMLASFGSMDRDSVRTGRVAFNLSWPEVEVRPGGRGPDYFTPGHPPSLALGDLWTAHRVLKPGSPYRGTRATSVVPGATLAKIICDLGFAGVKSDAPLLH